ncbi:hypothetical protein JCM3774_000763 [Rhodotorula dairenensis]
MSRPARNASGAKSAPNDKAPTRPNETRVSLMDLIWMLQPVTVGTPHSLPALGTPQPWYILPSVYSPMPAPWDRAPNKETLRLEQTHKEAAKTARILAQEEAKGEAKEPRDAATVKAEQNRKKKERKLRAKARREAEGAAAGGADESDGKEGDDTSAAADADAGATETDASIETSPTKPTVAYALPSYLDEKMQQEFLKHYVQLHADFEERRKDEAAVTLPKQFQRAPMGDCFMYPREHPDDPQRGVTWDKNSMTLLYHTE